MVSFNRNTYFCLLFCVRLCSFLHLVISFSAGKYGCWSLRSAKKQVRFLKSMSKCSYMLDLYHTRFHDCRQQGDLRNFRRKERRFRIRPYQSERKILCARDFSMVALGLFRWIKFWGFSFGFFLINVLYHFNINSEMLKCDCYFLYAQMNIHLLKLHLNYE